MRAHSIGLSCAALLLSVALPTGTAAGSSRLLKCAPGKVKAHEQIAGAHGNFLVEATERNEFAFYVCVVSPTFRTSRQNGVNLAPFKSGSTFKSDSLGHVFYKLFPGQEPGVGVVVLNGNHAKQLGIYADATIIQHRSRPFAIRVAHNDCNPDCASGHTTYTTLHWHASTQNYK